MPRVFRKRTQKAGLPPGTLIYTGDRAPEPASITVADYDEEHYQEREISSFVECPLLPEQPGVTWINVNGISQVQHLERLGECFKLHPLVLEDILNVDQRPKVDDYENYLFIVLKAIGLEAGTQEITVNQVSLILGRNYLLSFQEGSHDLFTPIRERLAAAKGRIRKAGADYLAYTLVDLIVDNYFVVLEEIGESVESLEEEVVSRPTPGTLQEVHRFKNNMIVLRRSLWPLREVIAHLERRESDLIEDATGVYYKDVYDHTIIAIDSVETYRDILSGLLDVYLSSVSNRLNQIMKVLTVIATVFMPLTFITGIFGMNFKNMQILEWQYGFLATLGVMGLIGLCMLIYFVWKDWI